MCRGNVTLMDGLADTIDEHAADARFSGVVHVDRGGDVIFAKAYGLADRAHVVPNDVDTQFAIASGTKGLTALVVVRLVEEGVLSLTTSARSLLGSDLPLVDDDVTIEHLLSHRSGIGDYLDEDEHDDINDYVMPIPVHRLTTPDSYLGVLDGHPAKFAAGTDFSYCNGGFVLLALLAERAARTPFDDLVRTHVCEPAGLRDTAFLRSDELPPRAASGYLAVDGLRTNVLHLPVRGSGDGGIYSTAADIHALWRSFFAGKIVSPTWVEEMVRSRSTSTGDSRRYGLGFWLEARSENVMLIGSDAGVSFHSSHDPHRALTRTVISNVSSGAWSVARHLDHVLSN